MFPLSVRLLPWKLVYRVVTKQQLFLSVIMPQYIYSTTMGILIPLHQLITSPEIHDIHFKFGSLAQCCSQKGELQGVNNNSLMAHKVTHLTRLQ
jgi:hypothetical protein